MTHIGLPVKRFEDLRLLRGCGNYVDDIVLDNMLHAVVLRSPVAHGLIRRIDASSALTMDGVVSVLTSDGVRSLPPIPLRLAPLPGVERFLQHPMASAKVRYVGEPVALVVATSQALAEDALGHIALDIEQLPAVTDCVADGTLLFEENGTNLATQYRTGFGDVEAAFKSADYRRRETLRCHRHTGLPMETRGLVARWEADKNHLTVWGMTKVLWYNRRILAAALGLEETQVDLIGGDVGGGFGIRGELYPEDFLVPYAARALNRPIKWIEDRREHLTASNHSRDIACDIEIACRKDGTILALRGEIRADMGAYTRTNGGVVPAKVGQYLLGPYRIPNVAIDVSIFMTNKTPVGTYRAPGRFEGNFFRERMLDIAAADLGLDPVEFRRKNLILEEELPYSIGRLVPYEKPTAYDTGDYPAALERIADAIDYQHRKKLSGKEIDGLRHGLGFGCFVESSGGGPTENARFVLENGGSISVHVGTSSMGQGHETTFAQIAAETLGIGLDQVRVFNGSTPNLAEGFGTFASRSAVKGGNAVRNTAQKLIAVLMDLAAEEVEGGVNDLQWIDGHILVSGGRRLDLAALAEIASRRKRCIDVTGTFSSGDLTYTYGAHAAYVTVDPRTGHVDILDYVALEDIGRALNPLVVRGQLIGAVVQGLGGAFLDHLVYDDEGQLLTGSLADYLVPLATDFPNVRGIAVEDKLSLSNPLGIKGGGEGGMVCVAAAVSNAVAAALAPLGAKVTELPLSPPRLWQAIQNAQAPEGRLQP